MTSNQKIETINNTGKTSYYEFFQSGEFTDVKLIVEKKEILAHKIVLASNSPVFKAMLGSEMREKAENRVIIDDIEYDVMQEVLRLVYTEQSSNFDSELKQSPSKILVAAQKYGFEWLRNLCWTNIVESLSVSNACEILVLADVYSLDKQKVLKFIAEHVELVVETPEFKNIEKSHIHLCKDIMLAMVKHSKMHVPTFVVASTPTASATKEGRRMSMSSSRKATPPCAKMPLRENTWTLM